MVELTVVSKVGGLVGLSAVDLVALMVVEKDFFLAVKMAAKMVAE